jgi:AbrB family looped-hinge helix DNA binding protein
MSDLPSERQMRKVREAAVEYLADLEDKPAMSTISSKNQITLPAQLLRELGLSAGDRLSIRRDGDRLILRPRPKDWADYYGGSLRGVYGNTKEEIDEYIREEREGWEERERAIEEAWAGRKPPAQE